MTSFVGRVAERRRLGAVLLDPAQRLVVVRGPSGIGKTALVERVLRDVAPSSPILGRAKYAEHATSLGLRPVVDVLSQAVDAALGRLYDPTAGAASLRQLLGAQYDTLFAAGFVAAGLSSISASSPASGAASPAPMLQSRDGTAGLVEALARVLKWLEGFALPVVLFIDDWHRAPNEAVGFVHACSQSSTLKLVLAARGEGRTAYPDAAIVVELEPLAPADRMELLAGTLGHPAKARATADWLGEQASGLPFELSEIALALDRAQAFVDRGGTLGVDPVRAAAIDRHDINTIIVQRARPLPQAVLRVGIAAALWGDRVQLDILARCLGATPAVTGGAAELLQRNGLMRIDGEEIAFPHDQTRASLLGVPTQAELAALANAMSDALLEEGPDSHRLTALRLKLVAGVEDVRDPRLARLFAAGAASARLAAQFDLAADFGEAAWSIAQRHAVSGHADRIAVLQEACFAASHRRQAEAARERCALLIATAANDTELAEAYEQSAVAMRLAGTAADAWAVCREGCARFGIRLTDRIGNVRLLLAVLAWRLFGRKARRLIRPDTRTEQAVTAFVNTAGYAVWERGPRHAAYLAIRTATRARLRGYDSALWQGVDALISVFLKDYRAAAAFGDKALAGVGALERGRGVTLHRAVVFGKIWRDPRASLIETTRQIYDYSIAENDLVRAANALRNEALWTWRSAATLEEVAVTLADTDNKALRLGSAASRTAIGQISAVVRRLREPRPLPSQLPGEFGREAPLPIAIVEYLSLADNWPAVLSVAADVRATSLTLNSHLIGVMWRFYENLARLQTGLPLRRADLGFIERVASVNPTDHFGKVLLLRAEDAYRRGRKDCLRTYGDAIEAARRSSSRLETGLTAECAAAAARNLGDEAAYTRFRTAAVDTWSAWGALAKLVTYKAEQLGDAARASLDEAQARAAMAERGERAKSRFLAEIGHELRTPLQAMQGMLDLAAERPEEVNLGEIRDVFGSLKSVVDDLAELGAVGAEAPLNIRPTDLAALVGSELGLAQKTAERKGLVLAADLAGFEGLRFAVDPDRVRQVVRNLVSNAIKYTERGEIAVRGSVRDDDGSDGRPRIALAVEDTGPGIPEERLAHIFEPFDRAGRKDSGGLGLGLALSRRIAERMGGSIGAENRQEGGSRFTLSFRAARSAAQDEVRPASRPLDILIVEDTHLVRRLMARLLMLDGHAVREAEDLAQGLEQAARHRYDLVLLDLHLPDGDGLSFLERWPDRDRLPVIVLTAAVTRETEELVRKSGAFLLRKPIAAAELRSAIALACGEAQPANAVNDYDTEMAKLADEAREEIARRTGELAELVRSQGARSDSSTAEIRQQAHRLAGLASQFNAPDIADAADRIEQACAAGGSPRDGLAGLERSLARWPVSSPGGLQQR